MHSLTSNWRRRAEGELPSKVILNQQSTRTISKLPTGVIHSCQCHINTYNMNGAKKRNSQSSVSYVYQHVQNTELCKSLSILIYHHYQCCTTSTMSNIYQTNNANHRSVELLDMIVVAPTAKTENRPFCETELRMNH